jgi:predicted acyltransferase
MAGMLVVNDPGSWSHVYPPLRHAVWHGCTPTDLVFPAFLFLVGVSVPLALGRRVERAERPWEVVPGVLRRTLVLIGLGLLLNGFPGYDLDRLRYPGVLQRLALGYAGASLLYLYTRPRTQDLVLVLALLLYWPLLALGPVPGHGPPDLASQEHTLVAWVDRAVFGAHLYRPGLYDPEGLLSTIPALGTALLGVHAGRRLRAEGAGAGAGLLLAGVGLAALGGLWGLLLPINKALWTSSFAVLSGGVAMAALGACVLLLDGRELRGWRRGLAHPLEVLGHNAILAYLASGLLARVTGSLWRLEDGRSARQAVYEALRDGLSLAPEAASLLHALGWLLAAYLLLLPLHRRGLYLRVR